MTTLSDSSTINISDEHKYAILSKLAYENLSPGNINSLDSEFSEVEKQYLEGYEVLDKISLNNGFQAYWLRDKSTKEIIYTISGTDSILDGGHLDFGDDISIGTYGMAIDQFISAYNYYQEMTHNNGDTIYKIEKSLNAPEDTAYIESEEGNLTVYYFLQETTNTNSAGNSSFANATLTGHSLGGHLAGLLSKFTGNQAYVYNAPGYSNFSVDGAFLDLSFVTADGDSSYYLSYVNAFASLFNKDFGDNNVTHIHTANGWDWVAGINDDKWSKSDIYTLYTGLDPRDYHSINGICTAYYAYETIKDIANGAESFHNDSTITSFNETFENVYKAYCLNKGEAYQELDYSEYANINQIISDINEWSETQKANGGVIKVDSFNHSTSLPITGTGGADIFYTGGGNDTVDAGAGNDIVYGIDLNGDNSAAASSTKTIDLGAGNDKYYGSNAKDNINCGTGRDYVDAGSGENYIDLGADNDKDTVIINNNASGVDTIVNFTSQDEINCIGGFNISSLQQIGNDMIIYGNNGNKIVFKDAVEKNSMPMLVQNNDTLLYWENGKYNEIKYNPYAMENPTEEHICALLSKLAYEDLTVGFNFDNLSKDRFAPAEIAYIKENFDVINVKNDIETGFFGCFLKNKKTGKIYNAIRGIDSNSLDEKDIIADNEIRNKGMAIEQFIAAYNYYIEVMTPSGSVSNKIVYSSQKPEGETNCVEDKTAGRYYYLRPWSGTSTLGNNTEIIITGHSLGGHLAGLVAKCVDNQAIVFNAPAYGAVKQQSKINYIADNGYVYQNINSHYLAIITRMLEGISSNSNIHAIYSNDYSEFADNIYSLWSIEKSLNTIASQSNPLSQSSINAISDTYYIYNTIKGIISGPDIFNNKENITIETAFDNVYQAYLLAHEKENITIPYENSSQIKEFADEIAIWRQKYSEYNILIDIKNQDSTKSASIRAEDGNNLIFIKNGKNSVTLGTGNDIVYATNIDKEIGTQETVSPDNRVYLGAGNDIFYGFNGNDVIDGGNDKDAETDKNIIYLGAGDDDYNGGDGVDIVDGGSGNTGNLNKNIYGNLEYFMTDSETNINDVKLEGGNDVYIGGKGSDEVDTTWGNDIILTGKGDDYIYTDFFDSRDTDKKIIYLGEGSDKFNGGAGDDIVDGGSGTKYIFGNDNDQYFETFTQEMLLDNENDVNTINLGAGNNIYIGGTGIDNLISRNNAGEKNHIWLGAGNDTYDGGNGDDIVDGGSGTIGELSNVLPFINIPEDILKDSPEDTNTINLGHGNNIYYGGAGIDVVTSGNGNDIIQGGKGNDILNGGSGNDTYIYNSGDGFDEITDTYGTNEIVLGEGVQRENITAESIASNKIKLYFDNNLQEGISFEGNLSSTNLVFADNTSVKISDAGFIFKQQDTNENITGTKGNDIFYGNGGDDIINGDAGDDIYIWNLGDGLDTIKDKKGNNIIRFGKGIKLSDLSFSQNNRDLTINVKGNASEGITIKEYFIDPISSLDTIILEDEQQTYQINNLNIEIDHPQTTEDTPIYSTNGNNILHNAPGNNVVYLNNGSNTFLWNIGDGMDILRFDDCNTGGKCSIKFGPGISAEDLYFSTIGKNGVDWDYTDLKISVKGNENQGIILDEFFDKKVINRLEKIIFDNGDELALTDIKIHTASFNGSDYNDIIHYTDGIYASHGYEGNDEMHGGDSEDQLDGGNGDDYLYGYKSNDFLVGGAGDDTYIWNLGDGMDTISDTDDNIGDTISFGSGITFEDLKFIGDFDGLRIIIKNDETQGIFIRNQMQYGDVRSLDEKAGIEYLKFNDGSTVNIKEIGLNLYTTEGRSIDGSPFDDIINGAENATLKGGAGNDTYTYNLGMGDCSIDDTSGENDKIKFGEGISLDQLSYRTYRDNLNISIGDGNNNITINNYFSTKENYQGKIETLEFADGSQISTDAALQLIQAMNSFGADTSSTMDALSNPTENVSDMCNLAAGSDLIKKAI